MPNKENALALKIKEQIIHLNGLTLRFSVVSESTARYRLAIESDALPFGNYELLFDEQGNEAGGGTAIPGLIHPDENP